MAIQGGFIPTLWLEAILENAKCFSCPGVAVSCPLKKMPNWLGEDVEPCKIFQDCPVMGKGRKAELVCPQCGGRLNDAELGDWPCPACYKARPPAQAGYEYTEEWRPPKDEDEPFLSDCGRLVLRGKQFAAIGYKPGPHWILRKVEAP